MANYHDIKVREEVWQDVDQFLVTHPQLGYRSASDFFIRAALDRLSQLRGVPAASASVPPTAVSPASTGGPDTTPGEPEELGAHEGPLKIPRPRRRRESGGDGNGLRNLVAESSPSDKEAVSATAPPSAAAPQDTSLLEGPVTSASPQTTPGEAIPSPPPAPDQPSRDPSPEPALVATSPAGEAAVERLVGPSAGTRRGGRSSRSSAAEAASAGETRTPKNAMATPSPTDPRTAPPTTKAPAADLDVSTRRCNGCGETVPLPDYEAHRRECPFVLPAADPEPVVPAPPVRTAPKESIVITRLEARVREESFRRLVRNTDHDPVSLLAVIVQQAYVDSGFPEPSDVVAEDLVKAFRFKSDPLDAALERLEESLSAVPRTKKGAKAES